MKTEGWPAFLGMNTGVQLKSGLLDLKEKGPRSRVFLNLREEGTGVSESEGGGV